MMAATLVSRDLPSAFVDPSPPQSLLLYPSLIDQTTLVDLAQFVRARNYHAYRDAVTRVQLEHVILANALIGRLASLLYYAQTSLVRLVVNNSPSHDNTSDFCTLTQAAQEVQKSITTTYTSPFENVQPPPGRGQVAFATPKSFLAELSPTASTTLLGFLHSVRTDPSLLCSRLLQAQDHELDALVSWLPHHHAVRRKSESRTARQTTPIQTTTPADHIISFHRHDPLYVLISVIFSAPHDPSSPDHPRCLDLWSSALAALIDAKRGDSVVIAVMEIWSRTEWEASQSFEIAILKFLQDAAKLSGSKDKYPDAFDEESIGPDPDMIELFDKTLLEILNIVNGYGGIPPPALELVKTTFHKCLHKRQAREVLFTGWFLRHFISRSISSPEHLGLLGECFVSEDQRLLLDSLYERLETVAQDTENTNLSDDTLAITIHLDSLKAMLFPKHPCPESPTHIIEHTIQPAIAMCPSDFLTTFYALYPKHRPSVATQPLQIPTSRHARKTSDDSSKSEITRLSADYIRPILKKTGMFDTHDGSTSSHSEAGAATSEPNSTLGENEQVDMYGLSVKAAIDEMTRRLGSDRCSGEKHPCEEMWVTLFIAEDGLTLSSVPDFELSETINENEEVIVSRDADTHIESALLKLAETATREPPRRDLETHISTIRLRNLHHEDLISLGSPRIQSAPATPPHTPQSHLLASLKAISSKSFSQGDYIQSQSIQYASDLIKSVSPSLSKNDYAPVVGIIARKIQNEGNTCLTHVRTREVWFSYLLEHRDKLENILQQQNNTLSQLRCKMWYANHVRQSKAWERAKDVCSALHKMKVSKSGTTSSSAPVPGLKRNSSALSLHRSTSTRDPRHIIPGRQSFDGFSFSARPSSLYNVSFGLGGDDWFDILTASTEQGGPHKLSDYQIDVTNRWMEEHASENFCRGEEIIHRFIAEVDDVARRHVPESADEMTTIASAFWESEEFLEDAKEFGLVEHHPVSRDGRRSDEMVRNSSSVDIFGLLGRSRGKTIGSVDLSDSRSIKSTHSRATSMSVASRALPDVFVRPSSSHSTSFPSPSPVASFFSRQPAAVPMLRSTSFVDEKAANLFLDVTRQRLVSLLLSDLGMETWAAGSETDDWFTDGLADACLERKRVERKVRAQRGNRKDKKLPIVPGSMRPPNPRGFSLGSLPTPPLSRETSDTGKDSRAASGSSTHSGSGFDFAAAYKRLLTRFSVHPAPHEKLKALYELEQLMNASFTSIPLAEGDSTSVFHTAFPPTPRASTESSRSVSGSSAVGTDDLIDEIQRLLRDPEMRPKTLFRDLAFVSAFVPPVTLTHHGEGKVFWDIGLAALAIKTDVVNSMVDWYEEIMAGNERTTARRAEGDSRARATSIGGMKDAARMLVITACEGNAVGQRELALLHLSHPSLLPLTTLPLTRPSDTFHKVNGKGSNDKDKYDPDRIALATHWFRLAAKNGDKYAKSVEGNWLGSKS